MGITKRQAFSTSTLTSFIMLLIIVSIVVSFNVQAQTRAIITEISPVAPLTNSGIDAKGDTLRGTNDRFGNETYRDNQGNTIRGQIDSFGNKT